MGGDAIFSPGSINPEQWRMLREHAKRIKQLEEYYRPVFETFAQRESERRAIQNAVRIQAQHQKTFQAIQAPAIRRSLEAVARTVNSPNFQHQLETVRRTMERARNRLGPEGLGAAEYIAPSYFESSPDFDVGAERALEKIRDGKAEEVLREAAALAASPEALEAIEQADKAVLLGAAEEQASEDTEQPDDPFGLGGVRAGIDVETVIANVRLSEEELQAISYYGHQLVRFFIIVLSVVVVVSSSTISAGQILVALGGVGALLGMVEAARDRNA